ncbi:endonuclease I [Priestia megaterium]|uniref:endonuclease I family protein n=1 Tax=Priestia megaterium TaxID=1404 RepID=UPI000BF7D21B|nr:endonuclease [Priestia megaterium]PFV93069.1 endonuclease I [Priestia megaterium]
MKNREQSFDNKTNNNEKNIKDISVNRLSILRTNLKTFHADATKYYDTVKDQEDIRHYYQSIDFNMSDKKVLFESLNQLLEKSHTHRIKYNKSDEYLKTEVDLHSDGTLRSIYSKKEADPERVIEQDIQRIYFNSENIDSVSSISGHDLNIEHVVPQSWFSEKRDPTSKKEPMRGDMHHLFYCEGKCNLSRGNKSYYDFPEYNPDAYVMEWEKNECGMGKGGDGDIDGVFEPEYGKGMVARATLYFLLRYPNKIKIMYHNKIDIDLLLRWHEQFPPDSIYEKHRNQVIYKIQGNRNPLIDFPKQARKIDFDLFRNLY